MILKKKVDKEKEIRKLHQALQEADSVIIGAGAGLSRQPDLLIRENVLKSISKISKKSMVFTTCILWASIPIILWKSSGAFGAGTSGSIVIR
jgi:hypothetical protein